MLANNGQLQVWYRRYFQRNGAYAKLVLLSLLNGICLLVSTSITAATLFISAVGILSPNIDSVPLAWLFTSMSILLSAGLKLIPCTIVLAELLISIGKRYSLFG